MSKTLPISKSSLNEVKESVSKKQFDWILQELEVIPKNYHPLYLKAMLGKSRAIAIKAECLSCCGWDPKEVRLCPSSYCPLNPYKPYN